MTDEGNNDPGQTGGSQSLENITPLIVLFETFDECLTVASQLHFSDQAGGLRCYIPEVRGRAFFEAGPEVDKWWGDQGLSEANSLRYIVKHDRSLLPHLSHLAGRVDIWVDDPSLSSMYAQLDNVHVFTADEITTFLAAAGLIDAPAIEVQKKPTGQERGVRRPVRARPDSDIDKALDEIAKSESPRRATSPRPPQPLALPRAEPGEPGVPRRVREPRRGEVSAPSREAMPPQSMEEYEDQSESGVDDMGPFAQPAAVQEPGLGDRWALDYLARMDTPMLDLPREMLAEYPDEVEPAAKEVLVEKVTPPPTKTKTRRSWRGLELPSLFSRSPAVKPAQLSELREKIAQNKPVIIAVGSVKGGSGKTTSAKEMAIIAGRACSLSGHEVAFVDANLANPDAWDDFSIPPTAPTVHDISVALINNELPPRDDLLRSELTPGLVVFPESRDEVQYGEEEIELLAKEYFAKHYPVVVVDLTNRKPSASTSPEAKAAEAWLHQATVLVIPMRLEKADMRSTQEYLETPELPPTIVSYIEPRDRSVLRREEVTQFLAEMRGRVEAVVAIPDSAKVATAHFEGQAVADLSPAIGAAYTHLLEVCLEAVAQHKSKRPTTRNAPKGFE